LHADVEAFSAALDAYDVSLQAWLTSASGERAQRFLQRLSLLKMSLAEGAVKASNAPGDQIGAVR
jgi:hypothetical protein